ncbi:MAG TPA: hemolysin family protein [Luteibaculaceae bacterium]|nr:hemolysin family protein [Luteibaculaceae bacterium]
MIIELILTLLLVLLNGFFVAAEFAIVKVRASQIEVVNQVSKQSSSAAKAIIANLDSYLAATQLGITLASLGLGWVGEEVVSGLVLQAMAQMGFEPNPELAHAIAIPIAFFIITMMHIVFGELAPKSLAIRFPLQTVLAIAIPLQIFYFFFKPLIWFLNSIANLILRAIGIRPIHGGEIHSEEELKLIIAESQEGGAIDVSERELIQNVFEFDNRTVREIQVPHIKIVGLNEELSFEEVLKKVIEEGYSRYPVFKGNIDNIIGVVHTKDLLRMLQNKQTNWSDLLRPVLYTTGSKPITELLKEFQSKKVQLAIVANEFGGTDGMVTMEDIIEELVGEIQDEYDNEIPAVQQMSDRVFVVNAHERIYEINKYLPAAFPEHEDYETLSGLIVFHTKKFPQINEMIEVNDYRIKILRTFKHSVETVELQYIGDSSS